MFYKLKSSRLKLISQVNTNESLSTTERFIGEKNGCLVSKSWCTHPTNVSPSSDALTKRVKWNGQGSSESIEIETPYILGHEQS